MKFPGGFHYLKFGILALTLPLTYSASAEIGADARTTGDNKATCDAALQNMGEYVLSGKRILGSDPRIETAVSALGRVGLPNGVVHSPPRNQKDGEICWSYALMGLAESRLLIDDGIKVHLSPERDQFYHIYFQLKNHLGYFRKITEELAATPRGKTEQATHQLIEETYGVFAKERRTKLDPKAHGTKYFIPEVGSEESSALAEVAKVGMVPLEVFDSPIQSDSEETDIENAIRNFIGKYMLQTDNLDRYLGADADGINSQLYKDLKDFLAPYLKVTPLRPDESFSYRDQIFTPMTFMQNYMHFDAAHWTTFVSSPETHDLALSAIADAIDAHFPVPIGTDLFSDKVTAEGLNIETLAQETGLFSSEFCPGGKCSKVDGGHEILDVNYLFEGKGKKRAPGDKITGLIVKNSWGNNMGRDVNGEIPKEGHDGGYWILTSDFLKQSYNVDPFDFVLPKQIADLPKYAGKFKIEK